MGTREVTIQISPEEFELEVKVLIDTMGVGLKSFECTHREQVPGVDGTYEIDITARFEALGSLFVVLIECKRQRHSVKRDAVQVLKDRISATGAHKGILFATTSFQSGAIQYASTHGIALVTVTATDFFYVARSPESADGLAEDESAITYRLKHCGPDGTTCSTELRAGQAQPLAAYLQLIER